MIDTRVRASAVALFLQALMWLRGVGEVKHWDGLIAQETLLHSHTLQLHRVSILC